MTDEPTSLSFLLSAPTLIFILAAFYIGRALWIARREWPHCHTDTKVLYLLVAPILTLAVDILEFTDRLFWSGHSEQKRPALARSASRGRHLRPKMALRSEG